MSLNIKTLTQALAKTAAVIEKTVTTTVQEVTGPRALQDYDLLDQIGTAGPALAWRLYSASPKTKPSLGLQYPLVCVWILDKKALTDARTRAGLSKATEDAFLDIVRADAGKLVRIRHPGIVHVVQALDETKMAMAMVTEPLFASVANVLGNHVNMEKVPRELKGLEMSVLEIKHGLLQLAESLDFLHTNARLVHRAISPEAVFITSSGAWKLGGFGFAAPVDQNAGDPNSVHPFHYPEYDVEDSLLPLQPFLNYTAPELVRSKSLQCGFSCDVFSLGCVAYHLLSHKPLLDCNNNVKMYMNRLTYLSHEAFSSIPVDLVADLQRMLSIDETFRPTALNFSASPFFRDDTRLRALRFLDHMLERDNMQKTEFLKALSEMWKDFDSRVLRYKVLPPLCAELRNVVMQPMILPMVLTIAESQDKTEFELYTLPALMPVLTSATGDTLFLLVKHAELIMIKATSDHIVSHLLPLFVRAYEDNDVRIQEEVLRSTIFLAKQLDLQLMKSSILPRVHALALRTTVAVVRVNALVCLGDLITVIDKNAAQEILQTLQRCTAVDRSAPTLMCTLGVANAMLKEYGVEFAAEHVLPLLVPLLTAQQLNVQQFGKFMFFVKDILRRIEEKRGVVVNDLGTKSGGVSNPASNGHKPLQKLGGHTQSSNKSVTAWDEDWSSVSKGSTPHLQPKSDVLLKPSIPPSMLTSSSTQPHESISPPVPQVSPSYAAASDFEWPPPGRAPNPATQAVGYKKPQATSKSNPVNDVEWPPAPSTTPGIPATGYENSKLTASGSSESNLSFDDPFAGWPPRSTNTGSSNVSTSDHSVQYPMQNLGRPISSTSNLNSSTNGSVDLSRLYEQKNLSDVSLLSSGTSIGQLKSSQLHLGAVVGPKSDKKEVNFGSTFLSSDSLHKTLKIAPPPPAGIGAGRGGKLQGRSPATASSRSEKRNADRGQARPLDLL